jgi:putative nucleotidyltransferase with HDIG domain
MASGQVAHLRTSGACRNPYRKVADARSDLAMRVPLRYKVILPFAILLVFIGVIGTVLATAQLTTETTAVFDAGLLRGSLLANQQLSLLEADRVGQLRAASDTVGIPAATEAGNGDALASLLVPLVANAAPANLHLVVLDLAYDPLLRIVGTPAGPSRTAPSAAGITWGLTDEVRAALQGRSDSVGQRYVFLIREGGRPMAYWTGPVQTPDGRIVGAMLVGQALDEIAGSITDSAFYDLSGKPMASSLSGAPAMTAHTLADIASTNTVRVDERRSGHDYAELFSTWAMGGTELGYLGVAQKADQVASSLAQLRFLFVLLFTSGALLALAIGTVMAAWITRPLDRLVRAMRAVSAGDLQHRATVRSNDEIGYLAQTFNEMTASLADKTAALEETTFASMEALARAIDARDPSTFGHSARVSAVSMEIAAALKLAPREQEALRRAALLHDIGKIGIEDRVLLKPGALTPVETEEMREHPGIGHDMLKGVRFLSPSLTGVLHHHERWDGRGYPDGLKGEAIPLVVRVLSVADVFDALTSDRPYRHGLSFRSAASVIAGESGHQFDPLVVQAFASRFDAIVAVVLRMGKVRPEEAVAVEAVAS